MCTVSTNTFCLVQQRCKNDGTTTIGSSTIKKQRETVISGTGTETVTTRTTTVVSRITTQQSQMSTRRIIKIMKTNCILVLTVIECIVLVVSTITSLTRLLPLSSSSSLSLISGTENNLKMIPLFPTTMAFTTKTIYTTRTFLTLSYYNQQQQQQHSLQYQTVQSKKKSQQQQQTITRTGGASCRQQDRIRLYAKLWERLQIDSDDEVMWYLLNCVATNEIDLLNQCRTITSNMATTDVEKFVIPIEYKTRSHGPNKMLTEVKIKYPGYVFAKLRLCQQTYEAIQSLDLCRSWMGTVNHKGYKKLPPAPLALNEIEIENFGLEEIDPTNNWNELIGSLSLSSSSKSKSIGTTLESLDSSDETMGTSADDIIFDDKDDEDDNVLGIDDEYSDPMYKNVNKKDLQQFMGLKVGDYIKITGTKNKYYNEDGIVRRLKDGKIFIRFYTYGTMFEDWVVPTDVRKLTDVEVLKGLTGPSEPITQRDFDTATSSDGGRYPKQQQQYQYTDIRSAFTSSNSGLGGNTGRNRKQDRVADQYSRDRRNGQNEYDRRQEEKNWNWYKDQQQPDRTSSSVMTDDKWTMRGSGDGSNYGGSSSSSSPNDIDDRPTYDRKSARQTRRDVVVPRRQQQDQRTTRTTTTTTSSSNFRQVASSVDSMDDWSAFVSPVTTPSSSVAGSSSKDGNSLLSSSSSSSSSVADDFFSSLMSDLSKDYDKSSSNDSSNNLRQFQGQQQQQQQQQRRNNAQPVTPPRGFSKSQPTKDSTNNNSDDDDFFASLMSDLSSTTEDSVSTTDFKPRKQQQDTSSSSSTNDDFFESLLSDWSRDEASTGETTKKINAATDDDSFFSQLEVDMKSTDSVAGHGTVHESGVQPRKTTNSKRNVSATRSSASSAPPPTRTSNNVDNLNQRTVPDLKEMLRERGLKVSGKKSELIDRLLEAKV